MHHYVMDEYEAILPLGLTQEERAALVWKIEADFKLAAPESRVSKEHYITFAMQFYARSEQSMEDVLHKYRAHERAESKRRRAMAFLADMEVRAARIRTSDLVH